MSNEEDVALSGLAQIVRSAQAGETVVVVAVYGKHITSFAIGNPEPALAAELFGRCMAEASFAGQAVAEAAEKVMPGQKAICAMRFMSGMATQARSSNAEQTTRIGIRPEDPDA